jgi:hypothetical protein
MNTNDRILSLVLAYLRASISVGCQDHGPISAFQSARSSAATSSDKDVNGIGAAKTFSPLDSNGLIISFQLEPSAHAPWTNTTLDRRLDSLIIHPFTPDLSGLRARILGAAWFRYNEVVLQMTLSISGRFAWTGQPEYGR